MFIIIYMKKRFKKYIPVISIIVIIFTISFFLLNKPIYKSPIQDKLYPVLTHPFTQYSSEIYPVNSGEEIRMPILKGKEFIEGNEASGYFMKNIVKNRGYRLEVSLFISPKDTEDFTPIIPLSSRKVNGLFSYLIDFNRYQNGEYIIRATIKDLDTEITGTLDELIIIGNNQEDLLSVENTKDLVFEELQDAKDCKCKDAKVRTDMLYHSLSEPGIVRTPGSYFNPIPVINPATGVVSDGVSMGTGFTTDFYIDGEPKLCKPEGQGVRSTIITTTDSTPPGNPSATVTSLHSASTNPIVIAPNGQYFYSNGNYGNIKDFSDDDYHTDTDSGAKSYFKNRYGNNHIFMSDAPNMIMPFSDSPAGYSRIDEFLSEVTDSDGKNKCRCALSHRIGFTATRSSVGDVLNKKCVSGVPVTCGNKKVDEEEECDDGNLIETDTCGMDCKKTKCGDGVKQEPNGQGDTEECDDGNVENQDACSNDCKTKVQCGLPGFPTSWVLFSEMECPYPGADCHMGSIVTGICNNMCKCGPLSTVTDEENR